MSIKEWQEALQYEINHLKKYGSTTFKVFNGHLLSTNDDFVYYFECPYAIRIPSGSIVKLDYDGVKVGGRVLSVEEKSIAVSLEKSIGHLVNKALIQHDPWELLEQLSDRLTDIRKSKKKRQRIKNLMDPSMPAKHPTSGIKSNVHELILRSKYNPITFVWGPPGTGKTYTLARVAANKYFKGKQVLVLAHSNQAVDVLMTEIWHFVEKKGRFKEGDIIRYGSQSQNSSEAIHTTKLIDKHHPNLAEKKAKLQNEKSGLKRDLSSSFSKRDAERLLKIEKELTAVLEKIRQKEIQFIKDASIIGTTLAKTAGDTTLFEKEFDLVIVDEASMAYIPQIAFATSLAKRTIVCGDFKQLPPIAASNHQSVVSWLKEDIFHKAGVVKLVNEGTWHPHLFLLKEQRRMHPDISAFTNKYIYQSLVSDHQSVLNTRNSIAAKAPFTSHASIILSTDWSGEYCIKEKESHSRLNPWQLMLSFQLIYESYIAGARSIGYVTPYRAQAMYMEKLFEDLLVKECQEADIVTATVHRFQGSERDVMIFDTVDSYPQTRAGMLLTGKNSERLLNVAITRTKGKFIHVTDVAFMKQHVSKFQILRKLIEYQLDNQLVIRPGHIGSWVKSQHPYVQWMHAKKVNKVFEDINKATKSILVSLPQKEKLSTEWKNVLQVVTTTQIAVTTITAISFPCVIIDEEIVWLGVPFETSSRLQPPYVAVRVQSSKLASQLCHDIM
ncbi:DNA helicase [Bacillus sp. HMF5848]|uniref:AAA domain-containing protein n=1 Tax=Bacillus sp. HMF5848 TaxID=2495421 RepID=UPI000F786F44|nr:AAA domain-containing protein [Bacillus sp. HMF5848]RSK27227.1 DNA helicase [Bacillus sp. HMF5848]